MVKRDMMVQKDMKVKKDVMNEVGEQHPDEKKKIEFPSSGPTPGPTRVFSKEKYLLAGVITFLIFSLGLTLGIVLVNYRYALVQDVNDAQDVNYLSLQLQHAYLNTFTGLNSCPALAAALKKTVQDLSASLGEVIAYQENKEKESSSMRKEVVQRRYILDNLRYWLLAQESKKKCHLEIVPIIYFYGSNCPSCPNQGTILSYFKNLLGEQVLVFPINVDLQPQEPMIEVVLSLFDVQKLPALIIDTQKYEGVVKQEQLQDIICSSLSNTSLCS